MPDLLPLQINRKVTETLEQTLRNLQAPEAARNLRAVFSFLLRRPAQLRQLVDDVWQMIVEDRDVPQEDYRDELLKACDESIATLDYFSRRMDHYYGSE